MKGPKAEGQPSGRERNHRAGSRTPRLGGRAALVPARLSAAPTAQVGDRLPRPTLAIRVYNYAKVSAGKLPTAHSVSAFGENNHIFVPIGPPTKTVPRDTCALMFGFPADTGCIAVYAHEREADESSNL